MTEADRGQFGEMLFGLGEVYGEAVTATRMEIYFRALADLPLEDIRAAATTHAQTSRFFPKPVEIREALRGTVDDQAEIAWGRVQSLVRAYGYWHDEERQGPIPWPDERTKHAALRLYGGWKALCTNLPANGPEMLGTAKLFKSSYAAFTRDAVRAELALPAPRERAIARAGEVGVAEARPAHG